MFLFLQDHFDLHFFKVYKKILYVREKKNIYRHCSGSTVESSKRQEISAQKIAITSNFQQNPAQTMNRHTNTKIKRATSPSMSVEYDLHSYL